MLLPILAYGDPLLKRKSLTVPEGDPALPALLADMWETMYAASGVGLAAPQVGRSLRLFVVDASPYTEQDAGLDGFRMVFVNPVILGEDGDKWKFNEGCLSIPAIREDVERPSLVRLRYCDEHFVQHEAEFRGIAGRIIQHEYDHLEGVLFTDRLSPIRRKLLRRRLKEISLGHVDVSYKMRFPQKIR